jgi:hypothetical protein
MQVFYILFSILLTYSNKKAPQVGGFFMILRVPSLNFNIQRVGVLLALAPTRWNFSKILLLTLRGIFSPSGKLEKME